MQKNAPRQRGRTPRRKSLQHQQRMYPNVTFRMVLRRLLDSLHRRDFRQNLLQQASFIQQFHAAASPAFGQQLCQFLTDSFGGNLADFRGMQTNGGKRFGLDRKSEAR